MKIQIKSIEDFKTVINKARHFRLENGRPFVTVTYAQSLDGSIATVNRQQMQLSGEESMHLTHRLRALNRSILVGIGTVLADNPSLTTRLVVGDSPQPIILDTNLRTPPNAKLVTRQDLSTWIVNGNVATNGRYRRLQQKGATLISCRCDDNGWIDLGALMAQLAERKIDSLMVEGGARVITSFIRWRLADLFVVTVAPKLVGGLPVLDTHSYRSKAYLQLDDVHYQKIGKDLILWARPQWGAS
ncbi:MAG: RibD family protein [Deltaproteobacteria bacterium]|jgi:3,4-dihydroxy 2-butanone 4-phosphate synthase/GTP cyclohydrolase II|nr:RibD family protein [Deltaproteobacteria bacterium]MBW2481835.1 RibD family protein [Deltaproteobacteria bacterium]